MSQADTISVPVVELLIVRFSVTTLSHPAALVSVWVAVELLGRKFLDLSIGEPRGPALFSARQAASSAVMSDDEVMHAYQYNGSPAVPEFSEKFIAAHVKRPLPEEDVNYLPISGIKPILGLLPLSCGCATQKLTVATTTNPGYPIPADW